MIALTWHARKHKVHKQTPPELHPHIADNLRCLVLVLSAALNGAGVGQLSDSCNFITVLLVTWEPEQAALLF